MSGDKYDPTIIHNDGIPDAKIVNVVGKYKIVYQAANGDSYPVVLNITKLTKYMRTLPFKYNPNNFAAAPIKILEMELGLKVTTALIFVTGSVIHTGGRTEAELRVAANSLVRYLIKILGIPLAIINFRVTNIVCKTQMGFNIDLNGLHDFMGHKARYKPKGLKPFPAVRIKGFFNLKEAALIFLSGAVVLAGTKDRNTAQKNHAMIYELCKKFADDNMTKLTSQEYRSIGKKRALKNLSDKIKLTIEKEKGEEDIKRIELSRVLKQLNMSELNDIYNDEMTEDEIGEMDDVIVEEIMEEMNEEQRDAHMDVFSKMTEDFIETNSTKRQKTG